MQFAQSRRPIEGAVATLGVSDRVVFLRKTYAHLGISLLAFAAICGGLLKFAPEVSFKISTLFGTGILAMLGILLLMMVALFAANWMVQHNTSRGIQYAGLALGIGAYAFMFQPLFWVLMMKFGTEADRIQMMVYHQPVMSATASAILTQAIVITLAIFIGLTLVVFITKKDFSFLRGILMIGSFAALGMIVVAIIFGFSLGGLFAGFMIFLMAGYILYETSAVMKDFPPTMYVAAAMMLFSTVVTLFWYVLRLLMSLRSD